GAASSASGDEGDQGGGAASACGIGGAGRAGITATASASATATAEAGGGGTAHVPLEAVHAGLDRNVHGADDLRALQELELAGAHFRGGPDMDRRAALRILTFEVAIGGVALRLRVALP